MNYGRHSIDREYEQLHTSYDALGNKIRAYIARGIFFAFIALIVVGISGGIGMVRGIIDDAPSISSISIAPSGFATIIYDMEGNELQKLVSPNSNRMAVSIDRVPEIMQWAFITAEDERFYKHNGIDPRSLARAFVYMVRHRFRETQGASTITQQLLKNNVFTEWTQEKTMVERVKRKLQEQYLAITLEKRLNNKKLILENYLNTINLGAGTYGVEAAAKKYFNKDVWDLNLSEATVLAGITQNPSRYNPIRHPDRNQERRERILSRMVELGHITEDVKEKCLADNVYERIDEAQLAEKEQNTVYSYFIDELTEQVVADLISVKGYTETQAYQALYSGGLRIYTTQDSTIQKICDQEFLNEANYPNATEYELDWALSVTTATNQTINYSKEMLEAHFRQNDPDFDLKFSSVEQAKNYVERYKKEILAEDDRIIAERVSYVPQPQASLVVMDQSTGYVKAIVGGRGEKTASLTLNRATNTYRQPGSTFKVLAAYAPALDSGRITLATTYKDEPYQYANGQDVHDWLTNDYLGTITVREAIANSVNIPAVKCITDITPKIGYEQLLRFGFTTLSEANDVYQPLALGGIYNGVSTLELTAAYAAIANHGVYTKPMFYTKILDQYGNVVLDNSPETRQVIKDSTAYLLTSAMQTVVNRGTGTACSLDNMPVAGKTGTTSDYRNIWFVGYTPYYTCGVWAGYDNNQSLPKEGTYHDYNKMLWKAVMSRINADLGYKEFVRPGSVVTATVCESTGLINVGSCRKAITEYFTDVTAPTERCEKHAHGTVDADDFAYYHGYGSGGNGTMPGEYALGVSDLGRFNLNQAEHSYNSYLAEIRERARRREEERKRKEEEERKKAEEAARAADEAARASEEGGGNGGGNGGGEEEDGD
ncbi:MAG: PBP1A family penicillin-binding protein [Lachnospiraceae bacterium]|nr:PBP1A family penicillin-binding protein [Lachnospiraceae bacterium]